jgi:S1-C subfamily serine protease
VSGSGSWNPQQCSRALRPTVVFFASLLLLTLSLACGSTGPPAVADASPAPSPTLTPATAIPLPTPSRPTPEPPPPTATPEPVAAAQGLPSIADVIEKSIPWVASITTETVVRGRFFNFPDEGAGSGIVVRSDGYLVTNYHVIQGANEIKVHLPGSETYNALVVGFDEVTDLAVLKINGTELPAAAFADSDAVRMGDWVITLGNALGLEGGPSVTLGIVSGLGRTITTERYPYAFFDLIQTDAAINNGNSGGPLIDIRGEVVGINQARFPRAQGMGFAISASTAVRVIDSLIELGRVIRPQIGFDGNDVTPSVAGELNLTVEEGVIVTRMSREGPAYVAGIRLGDVITNIDGIPTPGVAEWLSLLWAYRPGDEVRVEYLRNNDVFSAIVKLVERPS